MSDKKINQYRLVYMLPSSMDEKGIGEFEQKLQVELQEHGFTLHRTHRNKSYMVKTKTNKGSRGVYLIEASISGAADGLTELRRFFSLANETVVNYMLFNQGELVSTANAAEAAAAS